MNLQIIRWLNPRRRTIEQALCRLAEMIQSLPPPWSYAASPKFLEASENREEPQVGPSPPEKPAL